MFPEFHIEDQVWMLCGMMLYTLSSIPFLPTPSILADSVIVLRWHGQS